VADAPERLRVDKWLWHARVVKSRSLAAKLVEEGHVRINGIRADAPAKPVKTGDVLTIALERTVRVLEVAALGARRGPATEAATLYDDRSPEPPPRP
jgi:ribosome-associated heat shock protein Hsp15